MRLSDTFMELMSYTAHLLREFETGEPVDYENVRQRYEILYERALKKGQEGGYSHEDWQEAWFAVCTWTDEMLLCSDWSEKGKWESRQLQRLYFQTMNGGEEFFVRLSALPAGKGEVREVYLYCLAMGFKGRFFSPDDEKELAEISRVHLPLIYDRPETGDPLLLHDRSEPDGRASLHNLSEQDGLSELLFPEAYDAASGRKGRSPWRHGLSFLHLIVMAGSLLFLISLFVSLKNNLGHLVQAYILGA